MRRLEQLFSELEGLKPLSAEAKKRLDDKFKLEFNYNSNHLEGNTLSYGQTLQLLIFGQVSGNAEMKDLEEMKAHNVGLEIMKEYAVDKERPLTESLIRELNRTILKQNYWKDATTPDGQKTRMEVKVGEYKSRPNSVITATGEIFDYASPEETSALMTSLVAWYNEEEQKGELSPLELATVFHYRYIRIHPFEDGNGRIARLLVNYVLLRHGYPMIIVQASDKSNYLNILHQCDIAVGLTPSDGATATLEQIVPFVGYMETLLEHALELCIKAAKGEDIEESNDWSKKLNLKLRESKEMPLFSISAAQEIQVKSIYALVKAIDTAFATYESLFDRVDRWVLGQHDEIENIKSISSEYSYMEGIYFNADYVKKVLSVEQAFTYFLDCTFEERMYKISLKVGLESIQIEKKYNEYLTDTEIAGFVDFVGRLLTKFVEENY